jgi:hypothetical protein
MIGSSQDLDMRRMEEKTTILLLLWTHGPGVDYSRITPEPGMAMKKAFGDDSPLWQGAGKSFWTLPNSGQRRWWLKYFSWIDVRALRIFPMK